MMDKSCMKVNRDKNIRLEIFSTFLFLISSLIFTKLSVGFNKNDTIEKLKESRKGSQRLNIDRRD